MANFSVTTNSNAPNAWKAFDNRKDTSWVAETNGANLTFTFDAPTKVKGVRFTLSPSETTPPPYDSNC